MTCLGTSATHSRLRYSRNGAFGSAWWSAPGPTFRMTINGFIRFIGNATESLNMRFFYSKKKVQDIDDALERGEKIVIGVEHPFGGYTSLSIDKNKIYCGRDYHFENYIDFMRCRIIHAYLEGERMTCEDPPISWACHDRLLALFHKHLPAYAAERGFPNIRSDEFNLSTIPWKHYFKARRVLGRILSICDYVANNSGFSLTDWEECKKKHDAELNALLADWKEIRRM